MRALPAFGHRAPDGSLVFRSERFGLSAKLAVRPVVVTSILVAIAVVVFAWSLAVGEFPIPLGDVMRTLVGQGESSTDFVVRTLRLPRGPGPLPLVRAGLIALRSVFGEAVFATWEEAELMEVSMTSDRGTADAQTLGVEPRRMSDVLESA